MSDLTGKIGWGRKFVNAFRGIVVGMQGQNSFVVHLPVALLVVGLAFYLRLDQIRACLLLLCIGTVLTAELFNSSMEKMAKAVSSEFDPHLRDALDISSGAVLVAAIFASLVGAAILVSATL